MTRERAIYKVTCDICGASVSSGNRLGAWVLWLIFRSLKCNGEKTQYSILKEMHL
jgi:hypothetical protein